MERRQAKTKPAAAKSQRRVASFGMSTRKPTAKEIKRHDLKMEVRVRGQVVDHISEGGAAAKAGIEAGDVPIPGVVVMDGKGDVVGEVSLRSATAVEQLTELLETH
ncbi:MAG: hypothetical protein ACE5F1_01595 [Planctomycetota bacterium]